MPILYFSKERLSPGSTPPLPQPPPSLLRWFQPLPLPSTSCASSFSASSPPQRSRSQNRGLSPLSFPHFALTSFFWGEPHDLVPFTFTQPLTWLVCGRSHCQHEPLKVSYISLTGALTNRPLSGSGTLLTHCYKVAWSVGWYVTSHLLLPPFLCCCSGPWVGASQNTGTGHGIYRFHRAYIRPRRKKRGSWGCIGWWSCF